MLEEGVPGPPGIGGLEHAAVRRAEVERLRLARDALRAGPPAAAQGTGQAPVEARVVLRRHGRGGGGNRGGEGEGQDERRNETAELHGNPLRKVATRDVLQDLGRGINDRVRRPLLRTAGTSPPSRSRRRQRRGAATLP